MESFHDARHGSTGLNVLSLLNDGTAVALKYAVENLNLATLPRARTMLFFDMGATSTKATLVRFHPPPAADPAGAGEQRSAGAVEVLGVGWDEELGGAAVTARVVRLLLRSADRRVARDRRAMARLQKEANKAKEVGPRPRAGAPWLLVLHGRKGTMAASALQCAAAARLACGGGGHVCQPSARGACGARLL